MKDDDDDLCFTHVKDEVVEEIIEEDSHSLEVSIKDEPLVVTGPLEVEDDPVDDHNNIMLTSTRSRTDHMFMEDGEKEDDVLIDHINGGRVSLTYIDEDDDDVSVSSSCCIKDHQSGRKSPCSDINSHWSSTPAGGVANPDDVLPKSPSITNNKISIRVSSSGNVDGGRNFTLDSLSEDKKSGQSGKVRLVSYQCTDCKTTFIREGDFRAHMEAHLIQLQNSCALCNTEFPCKSLLQEHIKDHFTRNLPHGCDLCKEKFVTKTALKRHRKQAHGNHHCQDSSSGNAKGRETSSSPPIQKWQSRPVVTLGDRQVLKTHSTAQNNGNGSTPNARKPYTCDECGATFTQNGSLQVHLRRHRGEKPFTCQLCGNSFTRAHSLKVHMKTHTGEKPYACEYCGACFVTSSHLTVHRRTHTGERPYSCGDCGATFITTSHLNVHRRVHAATHAQGGNGGGNVTCPSCRRVFDDPAVLRHHKRTEHRGINNNNNNNPASANILVSSNNDSNVSQGPPFICKVCDRRFANHASLSKHMAHECG